MSATFLTRDEVRELTGSRTRAGQIANLKLNLLRFTINAAGWPVVPRSVVDGTPAQAQDVRPKWQPAALRRVS